MRPARLRRDPIAARAEARRHAEELLRRARAGDYDAANVLVDVLSIAGEERLAEDLLLALRGQRRGDVVDFLAPTDPLYQSNLFHVLRRIDEALRGAARDARRRRDPAVTDEAIRALMRASVQGLEPEPTAVLADALQETDRPELGEALALVSAGRRFFPRAQRGKPLAGLAERERALRVLFRRIEQRFGGSDAAYDRRERQLALEELREIDQSWREAPRDEREDEIESTVQWLETDLPEDSILQERAEWLFNGTIGHGPQLLANEIADRPVAATRAGFAELFRLVLAFEDRLPARAANRVWRELSPEAQANATRAMRAVLQSEGAEVVPVAASRRRSARSRP